MEEQKELRNEFRRQQEKYTYYIIALCITAIGYCVHITLKQKLEYSQIPLGLAVLSWGFSVYFGLQFTKLGISILFTNNAYFDVINGVNEISGTHPEKIKIGVDALKKIIKNTSNKATRLAQWQYKLFFSGMVFFIFWHVYEMYLKTL